MVTDLIIPDHKLYYMGDNDEWNAIGGMTHCDLKDSESTYCDIDPSVFETTGSVTFDIKMKKKQWYRLQKSLGFIKPVYKKKRKGKRYVWYELIKNKDITIKQENAFDILQDTIFNKDDFIYLDPPYSNTLAIYNEKRAFGGWSIEDDYRLFKILEKLDKCGIKWGLSNVFKNKDYTNNHLIKWCEDNNWNVHHLNLSYSSLGKGNANSDEVYICNYYTFDDLD